MVKNRKPLILLGARQVGKTFALKYLGLQNYSNVIYINFEEMPNAKTIFDKDLSTKRIIRELSILAKTEIKPFETLIIFDEIQEAPKALTSLKYFCENSPDYHIAAAGSLLGIKLPKTSSFPVGKIDFINMFPMSFLEFLEAHNELLLIQEINKMNSVSETSQFLHQNCIEYLKQYYYIGGMPEVVNSFIQNKDYATVRQIQKSILISYQLDISKHASKNDIHKIFSIWESIPQQLAKENKKFSYTDVSKNARSRDYENAIQWLVDAGLVIKCSRINAVKNPLSAYLEEGIFKLYLLDVGLLGALAELDISIILKNEGIFTEFKGALVENFIAIELKAQNISPYYWHSEGKAEVDFIVEINSKIIPIEVNSGINLKSRSLRVFEEKYKSAKLVRFSLRELDFSSSISNIPLYATCILKNIWIS